MGRDFWYYRDPRGEKYWVERSGGYGGYWDYPPREDYGLSFSVSRCNDVLGHLDPDFGRTYDDIEQKLNTIRKNLQEGAYRDQYDGENDAKEAIKVYREILAIMEDEGLKEIWLHYG